MPISHDVPTPVSRWAVTFLFLIGMATFLLLAVRSEINDNSIHENTRRMESLLVTQCEDRNGAALATNKVLDNLIAVNRANTSVGPAEIEERITLYTATKVPIADCTP